MTQTERARSVWIVGADGKAAQRTVQTSNWLGNDWIVTAGLEPGDLVIVDNLIKLKPGMAVQPRTAETPAKQASAAPTPTTEASAAGKAR